MGLGTDLRTYLIELRAACLEHSRLIELREQYRAKRRGGVFGPGHDHGAAV